MLYFAALLAVIGATAGLAFRWKLLLPVIVLLPFTAIIFAASRSLRDTVLIILVAEAVLQGGYFVGLLTRFTATAGMRSATASSLFRRRSDSKTPDNERRTAPR
jgi:hypothetical protein